MSGTLFLDCYTKQSPSLQTANLTQIPQVSELSGHSCRVCCKVFSSDDELRKHLSQYHPEQLLTNESKEGFQCPECSATFPTRRGLSTHIGMVHNPRGKCNQPEEVHHCPYCEKVFASPLGLTVHISKMHPEVRDVFANM